MNSLLGLTYLDFLAYSGSLVNSVSGCDVAFINDSSVGEGSYDSKHGVIRVGIGGLTDLNAITKNLLSGNYIQHYNPRFDDGVPDSNFVRVLVDYEHELQHYRRDLQYDDIRGRSKDDRIENVCMSDVVSHFNIGLYSMPANYYCFLHEIDAEQAGVNNAFADLKRDFSDRITDKQAEQLVLDYVNDRCLHETYFLNDFMPLDSNGNRHLFESMDDVNRAFDEAYDFACNRHMPLVFSYGSINSFDIASRNETLCYLHKKGLDPLISKLDNADVDAVSQLRGLCSVIDHMHPGLKQNFGVLFGLKFDGKTVFGQELPDMTVADKAMFRYSYNHGSSNSQVASEFETVRSLPCGGVFEVDNAASDGDVFDFV